MDGGSVVEVSHDCAEPRQEPTVCCGGGRHGASVGDSYDNALAESVHNLYKRELVKARGPWKTIDDLELATLGWVTWFNRERLHGTLNDVPPVEHEAAFYAASDGSHQPVGIQ
jgi:putative transposase